MQQQKGFVLVTVLIITTITTMLAFSQLSENRMEERMAGNQQKEINARREAEKGVFAAFEYIEDQNVSGSTNDSIKTGLEGTDFTNDEGYTLQNIQLVDRNFSFVSKGVADNANAYLKTAIYFKPIGIFDYALLGCKGVTVKNGKVDSYNSGDGAYGDITPLKNGDVAVVGGDIDVVASGEVDGSLTASGEINLAKTDNISGKVDANSSADLGDCDPLGIATVMADIADTGGTVRTIYESTDVFTDGNVYVYDEFDTTGNNVLITGDVTLYIKGDITTKNTTFKLADTSSSLTIYTAGQIDINSNTTTVYADGSELSVNEDGDVPLTIYSNYESTSDSDLAFTIGSNGEIYAMVYAPFGNISLTGGGNIMGAVRGNQVSFTSSAGQFHYDEGLSGIGDSGATGLVSYCSNYYYYPETDSTYTPEYCESSTDVATVDDDEDSGLCGYSSHTFGEYSEYNGAAAAAIAATAASTAASDLAIVVANAGTAMVAAAPAAERAALTTLVAETLVKTTACTEYAAKAEARWVAAAAAALIAEGTTTDEEKAELAAIAKGIDDTATGVAEGIITAAEEDILEAMEAIEAIEAAELADAAVITAETYYQDAEDAEDLAQQAYADAATDANTAADDAAASTACSDKNKGQTKKCIADAVETATATANTAKAVYVDAIEATKTALTAYNTAVAAAG